jgi:hypothetical protein
LQLVEPVEPQVAFVGDEDLVHSHGLGAGDCASSAEAASATCSWVVSNWRLCILFLGIVCKLTFAAKENVTTLRTATPEKLRLSLSLGHKIKRTNVYFSSDRLLLSKIYTGP